MNETVCAPAPETAAVDRVAAARRLLPLVWDGQDARLAAEELLREAREASDVAGECAALQVLTVSAHIAEDLGRVRQMAQRLADRGEAAGLPVWESLGRQWLTRVHVLDGNEVAGLDELATAEVLLADLPTSTMYAALNGLALTYTACALYEEAERVFARCFVELASHTDVLASGYLRYNRMLNWATWAISLLRVGDEAAAHDLRESIDRELVTANRPAMPGMQRVQDVLEVFCDVLGGRDPEPAIGRLDRLVASGPAETEKLARFALAYRLADHDTEEAAHQIQLGRAGALSLDDRPVELALQWLQARIAADQRDQMGPCPVWEFADRMNLQDWQVRLRRWEALQDRVRVRRLREERQGIAQALLEDPLTKAADRRGIDQAVQALAGAGTGRWVSVLFLDVDHFKTVNDTFGHEVGDQVLRRVVDLLHASCRGGDVIGRYGGDELVVLAQDCTEQQARELAGRLLDAVRDHAWVEIAEGLRVTLSIGGAVSDRGPEQLFQVADEQLYRAKRAGRDRAHVTLADGQAAGSAPRAHPA